MDVKSLYKRYKQLTWQEQLGNLASTLTRISSQAPSPESDQLVKLSLREAALLTEWSAADAPADFLWELAALQREVLAWHRCWPVNEARSLLALQTRHQADRLLQRAGLLKLELQHADEIEILA